jgi:hypothetical protein
MAPNTIVFVTFIPFPPSLFVEFKDIALRIASLPGIGRREGRASQLGESLKWRQVRGVNCAFLLRQPEQ